MNSNRHIDPEDLALFALQFLTPEQEQQARAHLESCDLCREELALSQGDLAMYALTAEVHSPPAASRDRLMQAIARERKPQRAEQAVAAAGLAGNGAAEGYTTGYSGGQETVPAERSRATATEGEPPTRSGLHLVGRVAPWIGWAVAAGLAIAVQQSNSDRNNLRNEVQAVNHQIAQVTAQSNDARRVMDTLSDPTAQRVTLTLAKKTPVPQGKATYVAARGALVFIANNLEPLQPRKVYELWLIPNNGGTPIAAGTFHPDAGGNASVVMPKLPPGVAAKAFGITVEDEGGAQTPTMPILLAGAAGA